MHETRGSDVWLKSDLRSIITALLVTTNASSVALGATSPEATAYRLGFGAALNAMATALGIDVVMTRR